MSGTGPVVGIIPARGGSKRIPRKNITPFLGVPIIARAIACLENANVFDRIVVSTDDAEVAELAVAAGAEVPFVRPPELADDLTGTDAVIRHAIASIEHDSGRILGEVCAFYPTAVLSRPTDVQDSLRMFREMSADFVFVGTSFSYPIQRALRRLTDGSVEMLDPDQLLTRSQDLEETFHDAGQFYWGQRESWMAGKAVFTSKSHLYYMSPERVQDIDTYEDWRRAELIFKLLADEGSEATGSDGP